MACIYYRKCKFPMGGKRKDMTSKVKLFITTSSLGKRPSDCTLVNTSDITGVCVIRMKVVSFDERYMIAYSFYRSGILLQRRNGPLNLEATSSYTFQSEANL